MNIPLNEVVYWDETLADPATGNAADADQTPTFEIFEETSDTAIVSGDFTKRTSKTGDYRGTITLSTANGFEVGKWYSIIASATVGGVSGKKVSKNFRVVTAETVVGKVEATSGDGGSGDGDTPVNHDTGGTDAIRMTTLAGAGIGDVKIRAYLASEYAANPLTATVRGEAETEDDGRWHAPLMLSDGVEYRLTFTRVGYTFPSLDVTP
jgi:hypothetical protein